MSLLENMRVFVRVVEQDSMSAAGRQLRLSPAVVSHRIQALESHLGVRLLNRTTRRHSLTEAGTSFFQGCQRMINEAESAEAAVTHLAAAPRGMLKVNAPMSFGVQHLGPALPTFLEAYPELSIDLVLNDRLVDLVDEGFDVGVRIAKLADSSLIARRVAPCRSLLCAAPSYLSAHGMPRDPDDLKNHQCLLYSYLADGQSWTFKAPGGPLRVPVPSRLRVNNGSTLKAAALGGLGIALLPTFIAGDELRAGRLVAVLADWPLAVDSAIHAVYPASRNLSPKVRVFIDFLTKRFGEHPYWDRDLQDGPIPIPKRIVSEPHPSPGMMQ